MRISNLLKLFIFCVVGYCLASCKDNDEFTAITYPEMTPGIEGSEMLTGNPGEEIHIKAQVADVHGLKKLTISSQTLPIKYTESLENKTTYLLDYAWNIPEDVEMGSQHAIDILIEGNTQNVTKHIQLIASNATDYEIMYVAFEDESQANWTNALTGLPRIAERLSPYTYSIDLYSPAPSTKIKFLPNEDIASEGYGENAEKGAQITLPEAGYYHIEIKLDSKTTTVEAIAPTENTYDKIYIVGSLTESGWDFKDDVNLMKQVYPDNPYLLSKEVSFILEEDGDLAFSTAEWVMWKPLKECSTWSEIKKWDISNGGNTQDIWWKAPTGKYEATLDYFLGIVTLIKK